MSATRTASVHAESDAIQPAQLRGADLPEDWRWKKLGDICETTSGGTPSRTVAKYFDGNIPWVKSGELPDGVVSEIEEHITEEAIRNSSAKLFPAGTLLIALYGATVGKLGVLSRNATTNQAVCGIFPPDSLDRKYLFWYLRFVRSDLIAHAIGGAQPNISQGILRNLLLPIAPPEQQKRIVAEIEKQFSRLDEAITNLKRTKANLKRYKAAVLKAAVEGKLTEDWRMAHPDVGPASESLRRILKERQDTWTSNRDYVAPTEPDATNLPLLPRTWTWVSVDQLLYEDGGLAYGILKPGELDPEGVPMLRVLDVGDGRLNRTEVFKVTRELSERFSRTILRKGDVLLSVMATVGRCAVVPELFIGANVNRALAVIKPMHFVNSHYLSVALRSPRTQQLFQKNKIGSAQPRINLADLRSYALPLPPNEEQLEIVAEVERRLSVIDELDATVEANLTRADRLRQSMLQQAFSGKLPMGIKSSFISKPEEILYRI